MAGVMGPAVIVPAPSGVLEVAGVAGRAVSQPGQGVAVPSATRAAFLGGLRSAVTRGRSRERPRVGRRLGAHPALLTHKRRNSFSAQRIAAIA